jgi:hypothetical protein
LRVPEEKVLGRTFGYHMKEKEKNSTKITNELILSLVLLTTYYW